MTTEHRMRGALLGLARGDVLGCPVEGWREQQIQAVYGCYDGLPQAYDIEAIRRVSARPNRLRPLGLHSDDTQQALALINICLHGWSTADWASCLVDGLTQQAWRGYGRNFASAVHALRKGIPPEMAGSASAGMGAAMRIGPVGALYYRDDAQLAEIAWESSLITHGDIRAGALAYAVAWAVARCVAGQEAEAVAEQLPEAVAETEADWLANHPAWTIEREAGHVVSGGLRTILAGRDRPLPELRKLIAETARPHLAEGFTRAHPNQGFVLLGGAHAIAMALRAEGDPMELLLQIIRFGFDTDTVGAIAGSILGARFGADWIPDTCFQDRSAIQDYADALANRGQPERLSYLLAREAKYTAEEDAYQANLG